MLLDQLSTPGCNHSVFQTLSIVDESIGESSVLPLSVIDESIGESSVLLSPEVVEPIESDPINSSKKRKRNEASWTGNVRKKKRSRELPYVSDRTGKFVEGKSFKTFTCKCRLNCDRLPEKELAKAHQALYNLSSFESQTTYICSLIEEMPVFRHYAPDEMKNTDSEFDDGVEETTTTVVKRGTTTVVHTRKKLRSKNDKNTATANKSPKQKNFHRKYTRYYYLKINQDKVRVCKAKFCKTLCIDSARVHRSMLKYKSNDLKDHRGKHTSSKKTPAADGDFAKTHIDSFPKYSSHYCRSQSSRKYLSADMNKSEMYKMYRKECRKQNKKAMSERLYFEMIDEADLHFKSTKKDTCKTCDNLHMRIQCEEDDEAKNILVQQQTEHHIKAQNARLHLNKDALMASDDTYVVTFDLEKTLPLPKLSTGVCFYKRQMWLYNMGIHGYRIQQNYDAQIMTDEELAKVEIDSFGKEFMYVWTENIASRGSQEVASVLIKHTQNIQLKPKHLIAWSDSCGGQNRNIEVALFWNYLLHSVDGLESITHKFLIPGHSYLPNDSDFSHIETKQKRKANIYSPEEYITIIQKACDEKPFAVTEMKTSEFISTKPLEENSTNRKRTTNGQVI